MKPGLAFSAAIAALVLSGCETAPVLTEAQAKAKDAAELTAWAEWYVDQHGWPPSDLGDYYQWQEAQLAETLLRQAEKQAKAGPKAP